MPSLAQQKRFIVDNVAVLNKETKAAILSIVMMEIGLTAEANAPRGEDCAAVGRAAETKNFPGASQERPAPRPRSVMYESGSREVDIDLDAVGDINPEVLTHIYNIVFARREVLSQPARQ